MPEATESNIINFLERAPHLSAKGKMTLIVPLDETGPDFDNRLYAAMCALFRAGDVVIDAINVPNVVGEQIMVYSIDIVSRDGGTSGWLDQIVAESAD